MPGVHPAEHTGDGVELAHLGGGEPARIGRGQHIVHVHVEVGQGRVGPPAVPIRRQHDGGHRGRLQPVAHGVEDRQVQDVVVEGVVEAVATHVVGGLEDSARATSGVVITSGGKVCHCMWADGLIGAAVRTRANVSV